MLNAKKYSQAIELVDKAIALDGKDGDIQYLKGTCLFLAERNQEAVATLGKAIALSKPDADLYLMRGSAQNNLGHYNESIKDFSKAEQLGRGSSSITLYDSRGLAYCKIAHHGFAIADYSRALELSSPTGDNVHLSDLHCARGLEYFRAGNLKQSISDLDKSIELNKSEGSPWLWRSIVKSANGDFNGALADAKQAERILGRCFPTCATFALLHAANGDRIATRSNVERAFQIWADAQPADRASWGPFYASCALAQLRIGDCQRALNLTQVFETTRNFDSYDRAVLLAIKSSAEKELGKGAEARTDAAAASKAAPESALVKQLTTGQIKPMSHWMIDPLGVIAFLLALLPSTLWLALFVRFDKQREPLTILPKCFIFGAISFVPAVVLSLLIKFAGGFGLSFLSVATAAFANLSLREFPHWEVFTTGPLVEECMKFAAARLAVARHKELDQPIDIIVYSCTVSLGLAFAENISYFYNADPITIVLRSLVSTPQHALFAICWASAWAKSRFQPGTHRFVIPLAIFLASFLHCLSNFILYLQSVYGVTLPLIAARVGFYIALWVFALWNIRRTNQLVVRGQSA
ncbi:MAG: PrsW family intramembrane metalloprotease [Candidatus Obscuribacterales bacterium]|nr:PrsW family intramembrane metalloprotease [Candidatus Obscuribacterales bacterium]